MNKIRQTWDDMSTVIALTSASLQFLLTVVAIFEPIIAPISEKVSIAASNRKLRGPRIKFSYLSSILSDTQFRGMFRMDRPCFKELCMVIENYVGKENFKSEEYLEDLELRDDKKGRMYRAHIVGSGGYLSGEMKVGLALRLMGGGSYWDVSHIFGVHERAIQKMFYEVVRDWFCCDDVSRLVFDETITKSDDMMDISKLFSAGKCPAFVGIIGAIDGWLVSIKPSLLYKVFGVTSLAGFWSRKGFYALNVQVICDRHKRVLWRCINAKGSEHDSSAFRASNLWNALTTLAINTESALNKNRWNIPFYLIGDSAYAIRSFLLTPYPNASPGSAEDAFNYFHSCNRINIECLFGELYARWGIFWTPLEYGVNKHQHIIDAAFRLHNFIVNYSLRTKQRPDITPFKEELMEYMASQAHGGDLGVFTHDDIDGCNGEPKGRPSKVDAKLRDRGRAIRDDIRDHIKSQGMGRPKGNPWKNNVCNFKEMSD